MHQVLMSIVERKVRPHEQLHYLRGFIPPEE